MMRRMKLKMKPCIISTVLSRTVLWPLKTRVTFLVLPQHRSCWSRATEHSLGWLRTRTHSIGDPRNISSVHHCRHIQLLMSQNCGKLLWGWHYVKLVMSSFFSPLNLFTFLDFLSLFMFLWLFESHLISLFVKLEIDFLCNRETKCGSRGSQQLSEWAVMRETVWVLMCPSTSHIFQYNADQGFVVHPEITIPSLTPVSIEFIKPHGNKFCY